MNSKFFKSCKNFIKMSELSFLSSFVCGCVCVRGQIMLPDMSGSGGFNDSIRTQFPAISCLSFHCVSIDLRQDFS